MNIQRVLGDNNLSIPTDIVIEEIYIKGKVHAPFLYVNIRTLIRNLLGSVEGELPSGRAVFDELQDEIAQLISLVEVSTQGNTHVKFYYQTYSSLHRSLPNCILKPIRTGKQQYLADITTSVLVEFSKQYIDGDPTTTMAALPELDIHRYDCAIKGDKIESAFILTHTAICLLSDKSFGKLGLIESHTGKLKYIRDWNTKLDPSRKYPRIPFNVMTLQVFGDRNILIAPMKKIVKDALYEVATNGNWTSVTTKDKVVSDLKKLNDKYLSVTLIKMFSDKLK